MNDNKEIYEQFVLWFASPVSERKPRNIEDFCTEHNIPMSLLGDFSKEKSFPQDVMNQSINWGISKFPEIIHMTFEEYKKTKNHALLSAYQKLLEFNKDKDKNIINLNLFNLSDDRYQQIIQREQRNLTTREAELVD